jgi:hypothetical protein
MTIEGKAVLITGSNRGIGRALVDEALRRGAERVYAGSRQGTAHVDKRERPMNDYTTSFVVDRTPKEAFDAINNVREWWGPNVEGDNTAVGGEFTYRVPDIHTCRLWVVELVPDERVVWLVLDSHMSFVEDQSEWAGTTITFEIDRKGARTEVRFSHLGLVPGNECYNVCSNAWGSLMHHSLPSLITTGVGHGYK